MSESTDIDAVCCGALEEKNPITLSSRRAEHLQYLLASADDGNNGRLSTLKLKKVKVVRFFDLLRGLNLMVNMRIIYDL